MNRALSISFVLACAACGSPPSPVTPVTPTPPPDAAVTAKPDPITPPDVDIKPTKLIDVDWDRVVVSNDAEALALWKKIAPTGADWEQKVDEIPSEKPAAHALALALLREGNFTCPATPHSCNGGPIDVDPPRPDSTLVDPCLRRLVAMWALEQLEPTDIPALRTVLDGIIAIPPPESALVSLAMTQYTESDQDERLRMMLAAWASGHKDLVAGMIGTLDEAHQVVAASKHVDPAVEVLSPKSQKKTYLAAIADDQLSTKARVAAMVDLAAAEDGAPIPGDIARALVAQVNAKDCTVAAGAARILDSHGDHRFIPRRTSAMRTEAQLLRAMCVLASWEEAADTAEQSLLPSYLGKDGIERTDVAYDSTGESNDDGDGDPHTDRKSVRVAKDDASLPELVDLMRAMKHCTGNTCVTDDHEFKFVWKTAGGAVVLARLEVWERPPCTP